MNEAAQSKPVGTRFFIYLGLGIFALIMGIALAIHYVHLSHTWNWTPAQAQVLQVGELCDVEYKRVGKRSSWKRDTTLQCDESEAYAQKKRDESTFSSWRVVRVAHLQIEFPNGTDQTRLVVRQSDVTQSTAKVGDALPIFVNPQNSQEVDRPVTAKDHELLYIMGAVGAGIGIAITVLGAVLTRLNQRYAARKAAKAEAFAAANPQTVDTASPSHTFTSTPKKGSSVLGWVGLAIFALAAVFAVIAIIGNSDGTHENVNLGAAVIAAIGLLIWGVLSALGRRLAR